MQNLILGGVLGGIFKIQGCFVPQKSIFDPFGEKSPARMATVKSILFNLCLILKFNFSTLKRAWAAVGMTESQLKKVTTILDNFGLVLSLSA